MKPEHAEQRGTVVALHVHPDDKALPCVEQAVLHLVAEQGIVEDKRYFARKDRQGRPAKRQVTLIEGEQLVAHAEALGLGSLTNAEARSNIETAGIELVPLIGRRVRVGGAVLEFVEPRTPCQRMDDICQGLKEMMEHGRQGVVARVVESGEVRPGDPVEPVESAAA